MNLAVLALPLFLINLTGKYSNFVVTNSSVECRSILTMNYYCEVKILFDVYIDRFKITIWFMLAALCIDGETLGFMPTLLIMSVLCHRYYVLWYPS